MSLGGFAPVIIFTFYKSISTPSFLKGIIESDKIPLVPIPIYLDEDFTKVQLDDHNRTISIDMMREGASSFERVSSDVGQFKFQASKDNIAVTVITALFDKVLKSIEDKNYSITVFYDNIFILDAALELFSSSLIKGTDLREVTMQFANRPPKAAAAINGILSRAGTAFGI
mgnify:CR=1 FL=1|tara:strand:- start:2913 stop:3425 length:513 start_codon:yes stop_codon:yes gene_type:complete